MDTELKFEQLSYADLLTKVVTSHEETLETALPDYCATASRILDATGELLVREKQPQEGMLRGGVRVTVLYLSEEAEGLQSVTVTVPFSCELGEPKLRRCQAMQVHSRLLLCEAKLISGRKLYLRVIPELTVLGYGMQTVRLCCGAEGKGIQTKCEEKSVTLLSAVEDRSCAIAQEFSSGSVQAVEDILTDTVTPRITGCQIIGSKLVVKGELTVSALVRSSGGKPSSMREVLQFSQILDGIQMAESSRVKVMPSMNEWDLRLVRGNDGCSFGLTARIDMQVYVYESRELHYVADLYSTCCCLQAESEEVTLHQFQLPSCTEVWLEEKLEFGQSEPFVYMTAFDTGTANARCEDDCAAIDTMARMRLLYLDEDGAPMIAERSCEVTSTVDFCPDALWAYAGNAEMRPASGGCVVRIPVIFCGMQGEQTHLHTVVSADEIECPQAQRRPSLVLRRPAPGECLWDIAKKHGSTEETIRKINHMEEDAFPDGMLLIPCV